MSRSQRHQSSFEDEDIEMFTDEDGNEIEDTEKDTDIFEDSPLDPEFGLNTQELSFDDL